MRCSTGGEREVMCIGLVLVLSMCILLILIVCGNSGASAANTTDRDRDKIMTALGNLFASFLLDPNLLRCATESTEPNSGKSASEIIQGLVCNAVAISPIRSLHQLRFLDLSFNRVGNISSLFDKKNYKHFY